MSPPAEKLVTIDKAPSPPTQEEEAATAFMEWYRSDPRCDSGEWGFPLALRKYGETKGWSLDFRLTVHRELTRRSGIARKGNKVRKAR